MIRLGEYWLKLKGNYGKLRVEILMIFDLDSVNDLQRLMDYINKFDKYLRKCEEKIKESKRKKP